MLTKAKKVAVVELSSQSVTYGKIMGSSPAVTTVSNVIDSQENSLETPSNNATSNKGNNDCYESNKYCFHKALQKSWKCIHYDSLKVLN